MDQTKQQDKEVGTESVQYCLVVEDNEIVSSIITAFLAKNNIPSENAESGHAGLEKYLQHPLHYNAIFTDVNMPGMSGCEMAAQIRASNAPNAQTLPIIALSASSPHEISHPEVFSGFLKKPFEFSALIDLHRSVVAKSDASFAPSQSV